MGVRGSYPVNPASTRFPPWEFRSAEKSDRDESLSRSDSAKRVSAFRFSRRFCRRRPVRSRHGRPVTCMYLLFTISFFIRTILFFFLFFVFIYFGERTSAGVRKICWLSRDGETLRPCRSVGLTVTACRVFRSDEQFSVRQRHFYLPQQVNEKKKKKNRHPPTFDTISSYTQCRDLYLVSF